MGIVVLMVTITLIIMIILIEANILTIMIILMVNNAFIVLAAKEKSRFNWGNYGSINSKMSMMPLYPPQ